MFSGKWSPAASSTSPRRETMGSGPSPTARPSWMGTGRSELEAWQSSLVDEMRWSITCCLTANVLTALYPLRPHKEKCPNIPFTHASSSLGDCLVRQKLRPLLVYLLSEGHPSYETRSEFVWKHFGLHCLVWSNWRTFILHSTFNMHSCSKASFFLILVILISFAGYFLFPFYYSCWNIYRENVWQVGNYHTKPSHHKGKMLDNQNVT